MLDEPPTVTLGNSYILIGNDPTRTFDVVVRELSNVIKTEASLSLVLFLLLQDQHDRRPRRAWNN
jgi:hypothetical protein